MSLKEKKEQERLLKAQLRLKDGEKKEELINIIINYPEIWNKSCPEFRDRQLQGVKWEEIAKTMKMSIKDVKNMWKYLKDQFRTNFHAVSKKKSGQEYVEEEDIKLVKWPYFKQLMFLKDVVSRRETFCNLDFNEEDGEAADQILSSMANGHCPQEIVSPETQNEDTSPAVTEHDLQPPPTRSSSPVARVSSPVARTTSPVMRETSPVTRASTSKTTSKKRKNSVEAKDNVDEASMIRQEISKVDQFLSASIVHECERNLETRPQKFCKYLAELLAQVPEASQFDCELELMGVVRGYIRNKNNP